MEGLFREFHVGPREVKALGIAAMGRGGGHLSKLRVVVGLLLQPFLLEPPELHPRAEFLVPLPSQGVPGSILQLILTTRKVSLVRGRGYQRLD